MITRDDVARFAGVSSATVSYVVNNGPRPVAEATRHRVLRAIEQLDYHPSAVARSLKTRRSGTIGLIIPDILNPIHATVAKAIEDGLLAAHCNVVLCNSDEDPARELAYLRMLRSKQVDGMILFPTAKNHAMLLKLSESGKPIVLMDRQVAGLAADCVLLDISSDWPTNSSAPSCLKTSWPAFIAMTGMPAAAAALIWGPRALASGIVTTSPAAPLATAASINWPILIMSKVSGALYATWIP